MSISSHLPRLIALPTAPIGCIDKAYNMFIESVISSPNGCLDRFLSGLQNLRSVRLHAVGGRVGYSLDSLDFSVCSKLCLIDLQLPRFDANALKLPPTVEILRIKSLVLPAPFWPGAVGSDPLRLRDLPKLREFSLQSGSEVLQLVLAELFPRLTEPDDEGNRQPLTQLRSLRLDRPIVEGLDPTDFQVGRCKDLESLALTNCLSLDDKLALAIVECLPKLAYLDVSETKITGAGVKDIVKLGHVQELALNNCFSLGRDAVEWARAQGVRVWAHMDEGSGGRKVRY